MNVNEYTSDYINTHGSGEISSCVRLILYAFPEVQNIFFAEDSQTGIFTRNALLISTPKIICTSETEDIIIVPSENPKIKKCQTVRVICGVFKGDIGNIACYHGQQ